MKLVVHVDGGARGNPGPAAIGVVVSDPEGALLEQHGEPIGETTNNVAEYRALLRGLERARALGADEVEVVGDSELVAKQVSGQYKVKHAGLKTAARARRCARSPASTRWRVRTVPRAQNAAADALVNAALDAPPERAARGPFRVRAMTRLARPRGAGSRGALRGSPLRARGKG